MDADFLVYALGPDGEKVTYYAHDDYSSLWAHQVGRLDGFDSVVDWQTATANFQEKLDIAVNCPIVAE